VLTEEGEERDGLNRIDLKHRPPVRAMSETNDEWSIPPFGGAYGWRNLRDKGVYESTFDGYPEIQSAYRAVMAHLRKDDEYYEDTEGYRRCECEKFETCELCEKAAELVSELERACHEEGITNYAIGDLEDVKWLALEGNVDGLREELEGRKWGCPTRATVDEIFRYCEDDAILTMLVNGGLIPTGEGLIEAVRHRCKETVLALRKVPALGRMTSISAVTGPRDEDDSIEATRFMLECGFTFEEHALYIALRHNEDEKARLLMEHEKLCTGPFHIDRLLWHSHEEREIVDRLMGWLEGRWALERPPAELATLLEANGRPLAAAALRRRYPAEAAG